MSENLEEIERLQREIEQMRRGTEQIRREREVIQRETEQMRRQVQKFTLKEYLHGCHSYTYDIKALRLADNCTRFDTKVDGKRYPIWLRPWSDFADLHRDLFDRIQTFFADRRVFHEPIVTRETVKGALRRRTAARADIGMLDGIAVEEIFTELQADPQIRHEFNFTELWFTNRNRELNGLGIRRLAGGDYDLAFVFDDQVAYQLNVEDLKRALSKHKLFTEVVQQANKPDDGDQQIAMALTQVFDHMIRRGLAYGYVTAGKALVFLHIKLDDVRTLHYHLCVPDEVDDESKTAVPQLASFCLLTFRSEPLRGSAFEGLCNTAELKHWPEPYNEDEQHLETECVSQSGPAGLNKQEEGPLDDSSEPTRQYCTQDCLLGLKRGLDLDHNCPNASSHQTVEAGSRHAITANELTALVGQRLRQNAYRDCVAVDPYGNEGKNGRIGFLFKLELAPYGYTFVAKGTQSAHRHHLQHEGLVYSRLETLQGDVVPVHLGIVDLATDGYYLPDGPRVKHMMLLSWGGEIAADVTVPDLATDQDLAREQDRSTQAVWREGVIHGDERDPNTLWNEERRRVMIIDFDQAILRPAP